MHKHKGSWGPVVAMWAIVLIATAVMVTIEDAASAEHQMRIFMAMLFLTFSIPKIMHLSGFAQTFARYDLAAREFLPYGYLYPFIEMALGFAYLFNYSPLVLNSVTLFVMAFSGLGVLLALHDGKKLQSASMGTIFTMPLGLITLMENAIMAGMALTFLWWM